MLVVEPRVVKLSTRTEIDVRRSLPHARLRRIGAWVFLDHFGPTTQVDGMKVAAHPHTGLQTVTWPFSGVVDHRDSIGSKQLLEPGQLNLMTAGRGIAHSEVSIAGSEKLHAAQLWLALPSAVREIEPFFEHHGELPKYSFDGAAITLFIGELNGHRSPAKVFSPLVGAQLDFADAAELQFPVNPSWEHGVLVVDGAVSIEGTELKMNDLAYLPVGASTLQITAEPGSRVLLIGGEPLNEQVFIWWNFIGRSHEEIVQMREAWNNRSAQFGEVVDDLGGWIPAPDLPNVRLKAR